MEIVVLVLKWVFALFFAFAGVMHYAKPKFFKHFIPKPFPKKLINYIIGLIEFGLGVGLIIPDFTKKSALGIIILLILFLPIHIWDVTRERPAIGTKRLAIVRIPMQFLLIYLVYLIYQNS